MNKPLPELISGRPHSPRAQVPAPFCTSPPFHDNPSFSPEVSSITIDSSTERSSPIPIPSPSTKEAQATVTVEPGSAPAPVLVVPPPSLESEVEGGLATAVIRAGIPALPPSRPDSSGASMSGTSSSSSSAIEGRAFAARTTTEIHSSNPPAEARTPWTPSPKRAVARHPLKPIHTSASVSSTGEAARAAAAAAAAPSGASSCVPRASSLQLPSGFSHKFRRRLLDAPEIEAAGGGGTSFHRSGHKQQNTGPDVAAAAAAAIAATVTVSSGAGIGPADDVVKRPGLLRRCISLMEESSSSRCPSLPTDNDQRGGSEPGGHTATTGMCIARSTSWEPFSGTSFEPPRGLVHYCRPAIPSPQTKATCSSLSGKCELVPNIVGGSSPSSKGIKAPPVIRAPAPPSGGLMSASPTRSSSFCGSDGGLRISPLLRSDSICSVSDADPEEEAHAASFFLSGSLGSEGAPHPPSPLHSCSPPHAATIHDVAHAGGNNIPGGIALGDRRTRGGAVQSVKPSPCRGRGRSIDSASSSPARHQPESVALANAETPKLNRQISCFERKTKVAHQESAPSRQKKSGQEDGREWSEQGDRARQKRDHSGCRRRAPISGAIEGLTPSSTAPLPAEAGAAGGRAGIIDRRPSRKHYLPATDSEHESYPKDSRSMEQPQHMLSPVARVGGNAKRLVDQPAVPSITGGYSFSEQTTPQLGACANRTLVEPHGPCNHHHGDDRREANQTLGAASSGGGGGGNLPASSSQGAGGTTVASHAQGSSLLVRRNDSILKSLLTGGSLDPAVGFPHDSGSGGVSYEFGLWKKKTKGRDEVPPISAALAATTQGGKAQGDAGLPPPPTKGVPARPGSLEPFPKNVGDAIGAAVGRVKQMSARTALEMMTTVPRVEQQLAGRGGARRRPSPSPSNRTLAKLPTRRGSAGKPTETDVISEVVGEKGGREPPNPARPTDDVRRTSTDVPQSSADFKGTNCYVSHTCLSSSSGSNSRSNGRNSLWPLARGSPPEFSPSPSPPPSPSPSPRQSPRAARAGTRPCTEVQVSVRADQPNRLGTTGKDPGRLVGLKASPPLHATSRFPLASHAPRIGAGEGENQARGWRASNARCRGGARNGSVGSVCIVDRECTRAPPQQTATTMGTGGCCCPPSVAGSDGLIAHLQRQEAASRSLSPRPAADEGPTSLSGLASPIDETDPVLHPLLNPEPGAGSMDDRDSATGELKNYRQELVPADGPAPAVAVPDDTTSTSAQSLPGGGQDIAIHTTNSREDLSESLTVEVSADCSSDLSQDSDSDSGRRPRGRGSQRALDDHEGCRMGVSHHPQRHAIHWKRGEQIGMGSFGKVFKGLNESTGELFAVKQISLTRGLKEEINTLETEIDLMKDLDHRHIVRYCGTDRGIRHLYIFLEYVPGGSIASMLQQFGVFREDLVRRFMHQILLGTRYLHDKGIIHRDIKGANVLVTEQGIAKLADFGCSKQFQGVRTPSFDDSLHTMRGSIPWMAPEMVKQTGHGRSADVWSVGATMIEMYTARYPWPPFSNNMAAMYHVATATEPPKFPGGISSEANDFLSKCLIIDPDARLKASELLQHPFLLVAEAALEASSGQGPGGFGASDGSMEEHTSDIS